MDKRGFKMKPEELQAWMAIRKKCHTHDNENKKAYTRKQKHKKEWAQGADGFRPRKPELPLYYTPHILSRGNLHKVFILKILKFVYFY